MLVHPCKTQFIDVNITNRKLQTQTARLDPAFYSPIQIQERNLNLKFFFICKACFWLDARWQAWMVTTASPATQWWRCWGSTGTVSWPCWRPLSMTRCSTGGSWTVRARSVTLNAFSVVSHSFCEGTHMMGKRHVADLNNHNSITWHWQ